MSAADFPWARRRRRRVSFRGIAFEVLSQERGIGHRAQTHTSPFVDEPYTEDFGRAPRDYRIEAFVAGADYDLQLARLMEALERRGRGRLELWYGDPVLVVCRAARVVETNSELGFARLAIDFVEAGRPIQPSSRAARSLVDRALDAVKSAATAAFPAVASNVASIASLGDRMFILGEQLHVRLLETLDEVDQNVGQGSDAASALADFEGRLASLATDAGGLATEIAGLVDELVALPAQTARRFAAIADLIGWGDELAPVPTTTQTGVLAAANQDALGDLVARLAAAHLATITARMAFESAQDAAEHRERLASLLDGVLLDAADAGDDEVYRELRTAKALAIADLDARAARLPQRVEIALPADLPSIVLGWRLYEDPTRGTEIADRNAVRHPAFLPATMPIEVLSEVPSA